MAQSTQLRPGETVLFEGDGTLIKSKISVQETEVVITDQRLIVAAGKQTIERPDIASAAEEKHGFTTKVVFHLRNGSTVALMAANQARFKAAAMILTGQAVPGSMPEAPKLTQVKNGTAWLAAFSPAIVAVVAAILGVLLWGSVEHWGAGTLIKMFILRMTLMWLFLRIDYLWLQKQGFNPKQLGLSDPITFPFYLFSRARVFGHSKAYAITWCVLFGLDVLLALA
jgi:hypothetical protein